MVKSPARKQISEIGLPGAVTPYYREVSTEVPIGIQPVPGQNFTEHSLFSLRTRVEADPTYVEYCLSNATNINFRRQHYMGKMNVFLVIEKVDFENPNITEADTASTDGIPDIITVNPDWLQSVTDYWLYNNRDYSMVVTAKYPLDYDDPIPMWWLAEVLPRLDISEMIREAWYDGNSKVDVSAYDYFYEDGSIYVRLIDPTSDVTGEFSTEIGDLLNTGVQAIKRVDVSYGDHSNYSRRYNALQRIIIRRLVEYYRNGVTALDDDDPVISLWSLDMLRGQKGLYVPSWKDIRLTSYDGIIPLLRRQMNSSQNQWDYLKVFYYVGDNGVYYHYISEWMKEHRDQFPVIQGDMLIVEVNSYSDATNVADQISVIMTEAAGTIIRTPFVESTQSSINQTTSNKNKSFYFDASLGQIMQIEVVV